MLLKLIFLMIQSLLKYMFTYGAEKVPGHVIMIIFVSLHWS